MQFCTDTSFWTHLNNVYQNTNIDLRLPLNEYLWGFTHAVQKELIHYEIDEFVRFDNANLIPFTNTEYLRFVSKYSYLKELGEADISVIYTSRRDKNIILTDDGALFIEAFSMHIEVLYIPEWCLFLVKGDILSKNECHKLFRYWLENHTYSQQKIKNWKLKLSQL